MSATNRNSASLAKDGVVLVYCIELCSRDALQIAGATLHTTSTNIICTRIPYIDDLHHI
jgi:hypothetical protein